MGELRNCGSVDEIQVDPTTVEVNVKNGQWRETRTVPLGQPHRATLTVYQGDSVYVVELVDSAVEPLELSIEMTRVESAVFGRGADESSVDPYQQVRIQLSGRLLQGRITRAPQA